MLKSFFYSFSLKLSTHSWGRTLGWKYVGVFTSTQFGLEHRDEGLDLAEVGHQVNVLGVRLAADGLQGIHVHPAHADGKDLDAGLPRLLRHLLHRVLRPPVSHYHGDAWDVQACSSGPVLLGEGHLHEELDGQAGHRPRGQVLHAPHSLLHLGPGAVGVEGELGLDHTAVLDQPHPGGVGTHLQELQQVNDEGLDLLIVVGPDASRAVNDKDEVQRDGFAGVLCEADRTMYICILNMERCMHTSWSAAGHSPPALLRTTVSFWPRAAAGLGRRLSSRTALQHNRQKRPRARDLILMRGDNCSAQREREREERGHTETH